MTCALVISTGFYILLKVVLGIEKCSKNHSRPTGMRTGTVMTRINVYREKPCGEKPIDMAMNKNGLISATFWGTLSALKKKIGAHPPVILLLRGDERQW